MMKWKSSAKGWAGLAVVVVALVVVPLAVANAVSTTDNLGYTEPSTYVDQHCLNGQGTNCNLYLDKRDVWLSGLPVSSALGAGTYFFAILSPGEQPSPEDGGAKNLSDDFDSYTNRTFSVDGDGGITSYGGTHLQDGDKLQMAPFADTTNNGGVYILAVCSLGPDGTSYPPAPSACKYDAFKVKQGDPCLDCGPTPAADLVVTKDANPAFTRDYDWSVAKTQTTSAAPINGPDSTTNVNYQVKASWTAHDSAWVVTGTITVFNPNDVDFTGVDVTDAVDNGGDCTVENGSDATIPKGSSVNFDYTCTYASAPGSLTGINTASAAWDALAFNTPDASTDFTVGFTFDDGSAGNPTLTHTTSTITDTFAGTPTTLGVANVDGTFAKDAANTLWAGNVTPSYDSATHTFTFMYTRAVPVVASQCTTYNNTAAVVDGDQNSDNTSSATVTVCGKVAGGHTLGFWSNKNGKAVLCAHDPAWRNLLNAGGGFLRVANGNLYLVPSFPGTSCANAHTNFSSWLLNANAVNMSYMLSAQLAATILDVNYNGMPGTACIAGTDGTPITINNLIAGAIAFLSNPANKVTTASGPARTLATAYKNIFDGLNNGNVFSVPGCV